MQRFQHIEQRSQNRVKVGHNLEVERNSRGMDFVEMPQQCASHIAEELSSKTQHFQEV